MAMSEDFFIFPFFGKKGKLILSEKKLLIWEEKIFRNSIKTDHKAMRGKVQKRIWYQIGK